MMVSMNGSQDDLGNEGMLNRSMTSDERISHILTRITYWEGIRDDARSGDHLKVHAIIKDLSYGPRTKPEVIAQKAERRLDTLRAEIDRLSRAGSTGGQTDAT